MNLHLDVDKVHFPYEGIKDGRTKDGTTKDKGTKDKGQWTANGT